MKTFSAPGKMPVSPLLTRLLCVAALVLSALGAQAGPVFTRLHAFTGGNDGGDALAGLVQGTDGYFYGTTSSGGTRGPGTVFKISSNGELTNLHSFTGGADGGQPAGALVQARDGYFYGTTSFGGTNGGYGTVFKITTNGTLTSLYSFAGNDGSTPLAGLVQADDGCLYGTTDFGGTNGPNGTVFRISTNGALDSLHSFTSYDGSNPQAVMTQGSDGFFYGTTFNGGLYDVGTVFKISANGALTNLYSFPFVSSSGGINGYYPQAGLVQGSDGYFYGTTRAGGAYGSGNYGTVFRITTNGTLTCLYSFTGADDGANPYAALVRGRDGYFYGTTYGGGAYSNQFGGYGAVVRMTPNGALTNLYSFTGGNDGASPEAGVVQGSDGNLYGTTSSGGPGGRGVVFELGIQKPAPTLLLTSISPNGNFQLTFSNSSPLSFTVLAATNLKMSAPQWAVLGQPTQTSPDNFQFTDFQASNSPARFYQLRSQ